MMFLEFLVLGSTIPIMSLYLKSTLGFTGTQAGWVLGSAALSSILSPLICACIADRLISAERLLSILHLFSALLLWALTSVSGLIPVMVCYAAYWMLIGPTVALTTAITFHHAPDAVQRFGGIRLWGTIGWIFAAVLYKMIPPMAGIVVPEGATFTAALYMGAGSSMVLCLFALLIRSAPGRCTGKIVLFPKDSFRIMMHPSILAIVLFAVCFSIADRSYVYGAAPYLASLGFNAVDILPVLSIGQIPEVFGLALLGRYIFKFGIKSALLAGGLLEITRFFLLAFRCDGPLLYFTISLHGLTYAFFFISASIYLDQQCSAQTRSGAHQYFSLFVGGVSTLLGNLIAGIIADMVKIDSGLQHAFSQFWIFPLVMSIIGFAGIALFFKKVPNQR